MTTDTTTAHTGRTWMGSLTTTVPIALGAMHMGTRTPEPQARRILDHYVGEVAPRYTSPDGTPALAMIDTADCYCWWEARGDEGGHSERVLGRWLADSGVRDRVLLATKGTGRVAGYENAWSGDVPDWEYAGANFVGASARVLQESIAASLERLGTNRVDLYYVHVDDVSTPLEETLSTLAGFVADGYIGAYGWSNVRTWRLEQIRLVCDTYGWPQPVAVQQQHTYLRRRGGLNHTSLVSDEQLDYLTRHPHLNLVSYSPVLKGAYSVPERRHPEFGPMTNYVGPDSDARLAALDEVVAQTGATGNQVALQWMLAQSEPAALPLIGPRTFDQYLECIEALDVKLTASQIEVLDNAGA